MVKYLTKRGGGASSEDKISPKKASKSATNCKTYSAVKQGYTRPKQCEFGAQNVQKNNAKNAVFESEKQRYKDCKVKSPNVYACKSDSSSKVKYLSIQRRNKLFVVGLFFFAFVFCVSAMFIAPNKMPPQTTTLTAVTTSGESVSCGDNATYTLDGDGKLKISGTGAIDGYVFESNTDIVTVVIGDGITSIGEWAFSDCTNLKGVTIPTSVTNIDGSAFYNCSGLTSITIPNSVTSIGINAFTDCSSLTSVTIGSGVTSIGWGVFGNCSKLTSVTIPDSVTSIGNYAFSGCSGLTSVTIPTSVTNIDGSAFENCSSLNIVYYKGTIAQWCNIAFSDYASNPLSQLLSQECQFVIYGISTENLEIPNTVKQIKEYAFAGYSKLTSITIPNSVTSIGAGAFKNCSRLTSVTIPNSVTSIGDSAFDGTGYLKTFLDGTDVVLYNNGVHLIKAKDTITECTIDENTQTIAGGAFKNCSGLTSITIPNSVTSIGEYAFKNCSGLTSVIIGTSVTELKGNVFYGCSGLTSITTSQSVSTSGGLVISDYYNDLKHIEIPDSVTSIGEYAFNRCSELTSVTIPTSVTNIGYFAFENCSSLNIVYYKGTIAQWCNIAFDNEDSNPLYYAHKLYINNKLVTEFKIPNTVKQIKQYAFTDCSSLTSVTIGAGVTSIGRSAFEGCSGLTSISVASGNTTYNSRNDCNAIIETNTKTLIVGCQNTIIPNSVTSIGNSAFSGCSGLESITIPKSVTSIGNSAFQDCSSLTSVKIPDNVTSIGTDTFKNCANLTIYGSGNENSAAYIYATNNSITYAIDPATLYSVTIIFNANIEREFIVYVLGSDGNPTRQLIMQNGRTYVLDGIKYQEAFSILVAETLYSTCTFKDTTANTTEQTRKKVFANGIDSNKSIEISISSASNSINNWVIL